MQRVSEHLRGIRQISAEFTEGRPYTARLVLENGGREHVYVVAEDRAHVPPHLPLLVGECLYHMRSCLDYLVLLTVPATRRRQVEHTTQFVIREDQKGFDRARERALQHVPDEVVHAIWLAQPFQPTNTPHLKWLERLAMVDRHRRPAIAGGSLSGLHVGPGGVGWLSHEWRLSERPLAPGEEIGRVIFPQPVLDRELPAQLRYGLCFFEEPWPRLDVLMTLEGIAGTLGNQTIQALRHFL